MSLLIGLGSNLDDKAQHLNHALLKLKQSFHFIAVSQIYTSNAVDYTDQPDFFNQVAEFSIPKNRTPEEIMEELLTIEKELGRTRLIDKGPRTIDLDLLFYQTAKYEGYNVIIPHPRLFTRSFVVKPLQELPYFQVLSEHFTFPEQFDEDASPYFSPRTAH